MSDIVVVGSINEDVVCRVHHLPAVGETISALSTRLMSGGKGANQAATAARLGCSVSMAACVGGDDAGIRQLEALRQAGVETSGVRVVPNAQTGRAWINVNDEGDNTIVVLDGANASLTPEDAAEVVRQHRSAKVLISQAEIATDTIYEAIQIAKSQSLFVIVNVSPVHWPRLRLDTSLDCVVVSAGEASLLTDVEVRDIDSATRALDEIIAQGPQSAIVTLGPDGCVLVEDGAVTHTAARPVRAVDTTGAGDVFVGALAVARARGRSLVEACRFAVDLATASVQYEGARGTDTVNAAIAPHAGQSNA